YSEFSPDDMQRVLEAYDKWSSKLAEQNLLLGGQKLTDEGGKVLQPGADGSIGVKDGPYVETKEVVGGYYLIKAESYEHAQELCDGHPNFGFGSIEIREIDFMGQPEGE
ncbi:MAG: YciI family protein, partial [Planctomycetota bacterium]